jgi:hypothetical protein
VQVIQAYRFALDVTPAQEAALRSHCGAQLRDPRGTAVAVGVLVVVEPAEGVQPGQGGGRAVVAGKLQGEGRQGATHAEFDLAACSKTGHIYLQVQPIVPGV